MIRNKQEDRRFAEGDDGRTIVNMNVEGMPWYSPEGEEQSLRRMLKNRRGQEGAAEENGGLTKREARMFTWGAMKAALLIVGLYCIGIVLFILFCQFVWFR